MEQVNPQDTRISIHALREEGDNIWRFLVNILTISIHALREEGDPGSAPGPLSRGGFLSTPSARRATGPNQRPAAHRRISIHALREEGDRSALGRFHRLS